MAGTWACILIACSLTDDMYMQSVKAMGGGRDLCLEFGAMRTCRKTDSDDLRLCPCVSVQFFIHLTPAISPYNSSIPHPSITKPNRQTSLTPLQPSLAPPNHPSAQSPALLRSYLYLRAPAPHVFPPRRWRPCNPHFPPV